MSTSESKGSGAVTADNGNKRLWDAAWIFFGSVLLFWYLADHIWEWALPSMMSTMDTAYNSGLGTLEGALLLAIGVFILVVVTSGTGAAIGLAIVAAAICVLAPNLPILVKSVFDAIALLVILAIPIGVLALGMYGSVSVLSTEPESEQ